MNIVRKMQFQAVRETRKAVFPNFSCLKEGSFDTCGFLAGAMLISAYAGEEKITFLTRWRHRCMCVTVRSRHSNPGSPRRFVGLDITCTVDWALKTNYRSVLSFRSEMPVCC